MPTQLDRILDAIQARVLSSLGASRQAIDHPTAKGEASEAIWIEVLNAHLPLRYSAAKAFVIDYQGTCSEQIDVVVFDRQYTPFLYNQDDQRFVPAESVYAVFEVKQILDRDTLLYSAAKAASVRGLVRTSAPITYAGGEYPPREPIPILAGHLSLETVWKPPFADPFADAIRSLSPNERIDIGCSVASGSFEVVYSGDHELHIGTYPPERALASFFFRLLHRLQQVGTVAALDYSAYLPASDHAGA